MKTASFKMTFMSGLMGLGYSSKIVTDVENDIAEEEQFIVIEEVPTGKAISIEEPETHLLQTA